MDLTPEEKNILILSFVLPLVAALTVAGRFTSRRLYGVALRADDWIISVCLLLAVANSVCAIFVVLGGYFIKPGLDDAGLIKSQTFFYANLLLCSVVFGLTKISILVFYKRIFATERLMLFANILICVVTLWMLSAFLTLAICTVCFFQRSSGEKCTYGSINVFWFNVVNAAGDLVLDVVILATPMPVIRRLNISRGKKVLLAANFLLGAFCLAATALRLYYNKVVFDSRGSRDLVFVFRTLEQSNIWARVEAEASIVAACLPTLGPLLRRFTRSRNQSAMEAVQIRMAGKVDDREMDNLTQ